MLHHLAGATIAIANLVKNIVAIHLRMAKYVPLGEMIIGYMIGIHAIRLCSQAV